MSTMVDTPKPPLLPPTLPLRLVRPKPPDQVTADLRAENAKLRDELEAERALVQVLRNQPTTQEARATEPTLPGLGAPERYKATPERTARAMRRRRLGKWASIGGAVIGLAAGLASLRYPGLMGPIKEFAKALTEALSQ